MRSFDYQKPTTIEDALSVLSGEDAMVLAGGMTLLPSMKQRLISCETLVDLSAVPGLSGIAREGDRLAIGAMTCHADVAASDLVKETIPGLAALAAHIGDQQVRHRGTIGGSISNNDPAADYPAALVALGAEVETSTRIIPAEAFFTGMFETALEPGEIVTRVLFPVPDMAGYGKFASPASRYALAGVFVAKTGDVVRAAVTGAGPCVFRAPDIEEALNGSFTPEALERITLDGTEILSDMHADRDYRMNLVVVMARKAVETALKLAG